MKAIRTPILTAVLLAAALGAAGPGSAAEGAASWHGEDNELGSIRMPYEAEITTREPHPVEARILLRNHFSDQDTTYFMFAFQTQSPSLELTFDRLFRADTGEDLKVYREESEGTQMAKRFLDVKDLPPVGTEIVMQGSATAAANGLFTTGGIVVPFTYRWEKVPMSNGIEADLYAYTQMGVNVPGLQFRGSDPKGGFLDVPGFAPVAALGAAAVAVLLRRRT